MNLKLVTLTGVKMDQDIYELIIPTSEGEIAVYPDHEPLVSIVVPGVAAVRHNKNDPNDKLDYFAVTGGVIEISNNNIRVLIDEADASHEIVESEIKTALERARKMKLEAKDQVELDKAHEMIDRHEVQLRVAEIHRRHRLN